MKKVLIVSYYFPPINTMSAKRYGTMCKYLEKQGYEPYVLTTKYVRTGGADVRLELKPPIDKDHIIQIGRTDENGAVKNFAGQYLIHFLKKQKYVSRTVSESTFGWYEKVKENIDLKKLHNIDIVIGTFPHMGNLMIAHFLARKLKVPYIAEIRDLISDYTETADGYRPAKKLDGMMEKYILSRSDGIVAVTPGFRDILRRKFPKQKFKVVFNGWDKEDSPVKNLQSGCQLKPGLNGDKYLYYAGSLYLHRLESFALLVRCIKRVNETASNKICFIVRSIGPKELDIKAKNIVKQEGMQKYVTILGAASEDIVRAEQEKAYMNVVLSSIRRNDEALMATVPGKVYELMNGSVPILAVVSKKSDVDKVLGYTDKGIASVDEEEIIAYLMSDYKRYTGNKRISYFSREKQAERLCRFLDRVLDV